MGPPSSQIERGDLMDSARSAASHQPITRPGPTGRATVYLEISQIHADPVNLVEWTPTSSSQNQPDGSVISQWTPAGRVVDPSYFHRCRPTHYVISEAHTRSMWPWSNRRFTKSGGINADRSGIVVQTLNVRGLIPATP